MIIPAFGLISEIIPVMSRKPIFGYGMIVGSGIMIGVFGFGVWAHHMFTSGLSDIAKLPFMAMTMAIAVPSGVESVQLDRHYDRGKDKPQSSNEVRDSIHLHILLRWRYRRFSGSYSR